MQSILKSNVLQNWSFFVYICKNGIFGNKNGGQFLARRTKFYKHEKDLVVTFTVVAFAELGNQRARCANRKGIRIGGRD